MKANTHPAWNHQTLVTCACGSTFHTGSSDGDMQIDICNKCHPFFTGEMKFLDVQGRVEKFKMRQQAAAQTSQKKKKKNAVDKAPVQVHSLKELLQEDAGSLEKAA